jgi:hypothetical protein
MPKGEKVLAQSKRAATTTNFKNVLSICIEEVFQLVSYFWYNFKLVWPPLKLISKTLLNTKRRISLRGSFVKSKEKHLKQGRKFQILKILVEILLIYLWLFAKGLWKEFPKDFAKTKKVVQEWSKMLKEIKQSMHILWMYKLF